MGHRARKRFGQNFLADPQVIQRIIDTINPAPGQIILEIGPGQALARMWNQRYEDVPARSVDEFKRVEAIAAWVRRYDGS